MLVGTLSFANALLLMWCSALYTERKMLRARLHETEQHATYWLNRTEFLLRENATLLSRGGSPPPAASTEHPAMAAALAHAPTMFEEARRQESIMQAARARQE